MSGFSLGWFSATPYGKRFSELDEDVYCLAATMAAGELRNVCCYCPKLYPIALQIKIALILDGMAICEDGAVSAPAGGEKIAYVVRDKVGDVERQYALADPGGQKAASTPAGLLAGIVERCRPPLQIGATLAVSMQRRFASCCAPLSLDNGALNDMGLGYPGADKSDG